MYEIFEIWPLFTSIENCCAALKGLIVPVPKAIDKSLVSICSSKLYFLKQLSVSFKPID